MKRIFIDFTVLFITLCLFSCGTTKEVVKENTPENMDDEVMVVDQIVQDTPDEAEYLRSIVALDKTDIVTIEEFAGDKAEVLRKISELSKIMEKGDYEAWLKYISPKSIEYYSSPVNIRKAQKKLPDKTVILHGLPDYFKYVFIPSRKRSQVDEIRYISKNYIKAVQVKEDNSVVIYYYFQKENGKWLVKIPEL